MFLLFLSIVSVFLVNAWARWHRERIIREGAMPQYLKRKLRQAYPHLTHKDADLVEVIRSLARIAGINVIFDPGVSGKVTAELVEVRWDHALAVIVKTQGLGMEIDGRVLTVAAPARLAGGR